jgi:hypothetical protein
MNKQSGVSIIGMLIVAAGLGFLLLVGFRAMPAYTEFMAVKKAMKTTVEDSSTDQSVAKIRDTFDRIASVDYVESVGPKDLQVYKEGGKVILAIDYEKRIPLFANVSLLLAFSSETAPVTGKRPSSD